MYFANLYGNYPNNSIFNPSIPPPYINPLIQSNQLNSNFLNSKSSNIKQNSDYLKFSQQSNYNSLAN